VVSLNWPTLVELCGKRYNLGELKRGGSKEVERDENVMLILVFLQNTNNLWWGKTSPSADWSPEAGQSTSPLTGSATVYQPQYRTHGASGTFFFLLSSFFILIM
jgi:hypothetical protein